MDIPNLSDVRKIWASVEVVIEEGIIAAEHFVGLHAGEEKKQWVIDYVTDFLQEMEDQHDVLPTWAEVFVLRSIRFALDWMIERVFEQLNNRGVVNNGPLGVPVA